MAATIPSSNSSTSSPPSHGKIQSITRWGTEIIHRPLRELTSTDYDTPELESLIADMFATMYAADGVGLAANQIGVDLKIFVYDSRDTTGSRSWGIVCNPVIDTTRTRSEGQASHDDSRTQSSIEGCLSYPGVVASVTRPHSITIRGFDQHSKRLEFQAQGRLAQVLQHETDHLNGIVYGDHVSGKVRDTMDAKYASLVAKVAYPDDWPVTKTEHKWEV